MIASHKRLENADTADKLLGFIRPLVESESAEEDAKADRFQLEEVQCCVARTVHLFACSDPQQQFAAICKLKEAFAKGKTMRMRITFPAVVWALYRLGSLLSEGAEELQLKIFETAYQTIESLAPISAELAMRLLLSGVAAMVPRLEKTAIRYMERALTIYQDELTESDTKLKAVIQIIGTVEKSKAFSKESFGTMAKKASQCAAQLLKKQDQCTTVLMCTHLFNVEGYVRYADSQRIRRNRKALRTV